MRLRTVPLYRILPRFARDPLGSLEEIVRAAGGAVIRLDLGLFRPYLVTRPEHVQHVLRDRTGNYRREGMLWRPLRPLIGAGVAGEGPEWVRQRALMKPMFSARHVGSLGGTTARAVGAAVAALDGSAASDEPVDVESAMTRIAHRALVAALFGDAISTVDGDRLGRSVATAFTSLGPRLAMPFLPAAVPVPGDRAFRRAVRTVDAIVYPLVREARGTAAGRDDLLSLLCAARDDDRAVRDDVVSIFAAGTETTAMTLTWLWVAVDAHPGVADRLYAEVDTVVGRAPVAARHLPDLRYTRMVLQEVLRLYPAAWFFPRTVAQPDDIDGAPVRGGGTMLLSPYLTQRRADVWERPHEFDPERFAPDRAGGHHRYAYFPFAGGPHRCLGQHFFTTVALFVVAAVLGRFRPELIRSGPVTARAAVTLRPRQRILMRLRPV
jgi:cytochrome P450